MTQTKKYMVFYQKFFDKRSGKADDFNKRSSNSFYLMISKRKQQGKRQSKMIAMLS